MGLLLVQVIQHPHWHFASRSMMTEDLTGVVHGVDFILAT